MTTWTDVFGGSPVNPSDVTYQAINITTVNNPIQLSWPNAFYQGTITAGHIIDISNDVGVGSPVIILGDATQVSQGQDILFRNVGAHTIQIQTFGGGFLLNIPTNTAFYIYLQANSTSVGTWGIVQFGTGTSSADATTLAGYGLIALSNAKINVNTPVVVKNAPFTLDATSRGSIYIWTGGAQTIELPDPGGMDIGNGYIVTFNNESSIGGTLTLHNANGNIDSTNTLELLPGSSTSVISDGGGNYYTIGLGTPTFFSVGYLDLDVSGSTDVELTVAQAQNIIQQYDGVLTGNINVIFPPTTYFNFIFNNTSGAFTLSVLVSGGTPIIVPQGQKIIVYNNGTNLEESPTFDPTLNTVKFIVQTPPPAGILPDAQALSLLTTGIVKNTTTTGVLSIGIPNTDYLVNPVPDIQFAVNNTPPGAPANGSILQMLTNQEFLFTYSDHNLYFYSSATNNLGFNTNGFALPGNSGANNVAWGPGSGTSLENGSSNTFMGVNAGSNEDNGSGNTYCGFGVNPVSGQTNCTFFGANITTANAAVLTNATAIGNNITISTGNTIVLGKNANVVVGETGQIAGDYGIGLYSSGSSANFYMGRSLAPTPPAPNGGVAWVDDDDLARYTNGSSDSYLNDVYVFSADISAPTGSFVTDFNVDIGGATATLMSWLNNGFPNPNAILVIEGCWYVAYPAPAFGFNGFSLITEFAKYDGTNHVPVTGVPSSAGAVMQNLAYNQVYYFSVPFKCQTLASAAVDPTIIAPSLLVTNGGAAGTTVTIVGAEELINITVYMNGFTT